MSVFYQNLNLNREISGYELNIWNDKQPLYQIVNNSNSNNNKFTILENIFYFINRKLFKLNKIIIPNDAICKIGDKYEMISTNKLIITKENIHVKDLNVMNNIKCCELIVCKNHEMLQFISKEMHTNEICKRAIATNILALKYIKNLTHEL